MSVNRSCCADPVAQGPPQFLESPAWRRLEEQLQWYDVKSMHCQKLYKLLKLLQVVLAVLIPIMALLRVEWARWATALAGAAIAVLEVVQQVNQYSTLWVTYRATAEHLKHEKYLFLSVAGPYRGLAEEDKLPTLAERVEEHISTEHAKWFSETRRIVAAPRREGG